LGSIIILGMFEKTLLATSNQSLCAKFGELENLEGHLSVAPSFRIALAEIRNSAYNLILIDSALDGGDGLSLGPVIQSRQPACKVILLSHHQKWAISDASAQLGFHGVIDISLSGEEILKKAFEAQKRESKLENSVLKNLSLREREILTCLASGLQNSEIADLHRISSATIKSHLTSIYRKLGVRNRVEATALLHR
jgi:DNA-binding NarL/FixJ family response regulator